MLVEFDDEKGVARYVPELCETCRWYARGEGTEDEGHGECRHGAPMTMQTSEGLVFLGVHPKVSDRHWCGEHEPSERSIAEHFETFSKR